MNFHKRNSDISLINLKFSIYCTGHCRGTSDGRTYVPWVISNVSGGVSTGTFGRLRGKGGERGVGGGGRRQIRKVRKD